MKISNSTQVKVVVGNFGDMGQFAFRVVYYMYPEIPTTMKTMGVNITTIAYPRVLIIEIGSTITLMVVEAQGVHRYWYV